MSDPDGVVFIRANHLREIADKPTQGFTNEDWQEIMNFLQDEANERRLSATIQILDKYDDDEVSDARKILSQLGYHTVYDSEERYLTIKW